MGSSRRSVCFKGLFGALAVVVIIWLLLVGTVLQNEETKTKTAVMSTTLDDQSTKNLKHDEGLGREKSVVNSELDLNYMSKRKVPNGPDPIHNRRAGNSRRPPGRA